MNKLHEDILSILSYLPLFIRKVWEVIWRNY